MKGLTLTQPWATLVAIGAKRVETRNWRTHYRGEIAIHAAKGFPDYAVEACHEEPFRSILGAAGIERVNQLPRGVVVATVRLQDCVPTDSVLSWITDHERAFGNFDAGRFAWVFSPGVRRLRTPVECRGMLGTWAVSAELRHRIEASP